MSDDKDNGDALPAGRRKDDRRKSQQPFDGPDRRKGDRRSGKDRRETERRTGGDEPGNDMTES